MVILHFLDDDPGDFLLLVVDVVGPFDGHVIAGGDLLQAQVQALPDEEGESLGTSSPLIAIVNQRPPAGECQLFPSTTTLKLLFGDK